MKFWFWQTILCLQFGLFWGQNPCEPNPCGINTRCLTQPGRSGSPVISCKCLAGRYLKIPSFALTYPSFALFKSALNKDLLYNKLLMHYILKNRVSTR